MALKRQQAAEDVVALGLRTIATGCHLQALPPGPIFGMKMLDPQVHQVAPTSGTKEDTDRNELSPHNDSQPSSTTTSTSIANNLSTSKSHKSGNEGHHRVKIRKSQEVTTHPHESQSPKDVLKRLFPTYPEQLLDQVLLQNDHNLVKTIQKLTPHQKTGSTGHKTTNRDYNSGNKYAILFNNNIFDYFLSSHKYFKNFKMLHFNFFQI